MLHMNLIIYYLYSIADLLLNCKAFVPKSYPQIYVDKSMFGIVDNYVDNVDKC